MVVRKSAGMGEKRLANAEWNLITAMPRADASPLPRRTVSEEFYTFRERLACSEG
jgi:hypothetical protein